MRGLPLREGDPCLFRRGAVIPGGKRLLILAGIKHLTMPKYAACCVDKLLVPTSHNPLSLPLAYRIRAIPQPHHPLKQKNIPRALGALKYPTSGKSNTQMQGTVHHTAL